MRRLRLTSPLLEGPDVRDLQKALNRVHRKHPNIQPVDVDGQYGPQTDQRTRQVAFLLGVGRHHNQGAIGAYAQTIIRNPKLRNPVQRARSRKRFEAFRGSLRSVEGVLAWCRAQIGTAESPYGSNRGPKVSVWERDFHMDGQPWCGAFVGYALRHTGGIPVPDGVVYTPNIVGYGRSGTGGFTNFVSWSKRKPGDLVLFKWPGVSNAVCDHVGILDADREHTLEGNTSSGDAGSQNNGGGVYRRQRGGQFVVGCARPRWK